MSRAAACRLGVLWLGESRNSVLGILVLEKPTLRRRKGKTEEQGAQRQSLKSGDRKEQLNTQDNGVRT